MGRMKDWLIEQMEKEGFYEDDYIEDPILIADRERINEMLLIHAYGKKPNVNSAEREYRYERRGDEFMLKMWCDGKETTSRGHTYALPGWLERIIDVSRVAQQIKRVNQPPPDEILWFRTDMNNNLTTFVELG